LILFEAIFDFLIIISRSIDFKRGGLNLHDRKYSGPD
jgi:hypothetical protein